MSEDRTRHFISDRQLLRALAREDQMDAVRELLDEAWNKGFSAGQMKARLTPIPSRPDWHFEERL